MNIAQEILKEPHFSKIINELYKQILFQKKQDNIIINDDKINSLRHHFCCAYIEQNPEKIYNSASFDFFFRYGLSNLIKNYYLLSELNQLGLLHSTENILDMGSGPGIFSLAYLIWHIDHSGLSNKLNKIIMVDGAKEFLSLFENLWKNMEAKEKRHFNIVTVPSPSDGTFPNEIAQPDLIIFSNSLSEMLRDSRVQVNKLIRNLIEAKAVIIIIDYPYDNTVKLLEKFTSILRPYYQNLSFYEWPYWNDFFQSVNLNKIDHAIEIDSKLKTRIVSNVKFLKAILIPREGRIYSAPSRYSELVMQYKKAWEQHDLNILKKLFSQDAIYQEKREREPFDGIDNICKYWVRNARQQKNVVFSPLFITEDDNLLRCLWKSKFYREDLKRWLILTGEFIAEIRDNKIYSFKENYEKTIVSRRIGKSEKWDGCTSSLTR